MSALMALKFELAWTGAAAPDSGWIACWRRSLGTIGVGFGSRDPAGTPRPIGRNRHRRVHRNQRSRLVGPHPQCRRLCGREAVFRATTRLGVSDRGAERSGANVLVHRDNADERPAVCGMAGSVRKRCLHNPTDL